MVMVYLATNQISLFIKDLAEHLSAKWENQCCRGLGEATPLFAAL